MERLDSCPLTGVKIINQTNDGENIWYSILINKRKFELMFCKKCCKRMMNELEVLPPHHVMKGLFLNDKLGQLDGNLIHWDTSEEGIDLKNEIQQIAYPQSPQELLENLFVHLISLQDSKGSTVSFSFEDSDSPNKLFFKNKQEVIFFIEALQGKGYVEVGNITSANAQCRITYDGLNAFIQLSEEGSNSNRCFVAMSFQEETRPIRTAIKNALIKTGFVPILIDEQHISSEKTINDEIIAGIKKSKFCIADFSYHKNGVYFESGFALGQGKQVIYTCE